MCEAERAFQWNQDIIESTRKQIASLLLELWKSSLQEPSANRPKTLKKKPFQVTPTQQRQILMRHAICTFEKWNPGVKVPKKEIEIMVKWRQRNENCSIPQFKLVHSCPILLRSVKWAEKFTREACEDAGVASSFQCHWNPKLEHTINDALLLDREKHNVLLCEWTLEEIPSSGDCGYFALFKAVRQKWQHRNKFMPCKAFSSTTVPETLEHFRCILAHYISRNRKRLHEYVTHNYPDIRQWNLYRHIVPADELLTKHWDSAIWEKPVFDLISTPAYLCDRAGGSIDEFVSVWLTDDVMEAIQDLYGLKILIVRTPITEVIGETDMVIVPGQCTEAIHLWPDFRRWREKNIGYVLLDFHDSHFNLYSSRLTGLSVLTAMEFQELNTVKACFTDFCPRSRLYLKSLLPYWYERITREHYEGLCRFGDLRPECLHISDLFQMILSSTSPTSSYTFQCETSTMLVHPETGGDQFTLVLHGNTRLDVKSKKGISVRVNITTDGVMITLETVHEFRELNALILLVTYLGGLLLSVENRSTDYVERYRNVIVTYIPGSTIWNTSEFKDWKSTHHFIQAGRACTFGGRTMPSNVKYYILSAIKDEKFDNSFTSSSESEDPDESTPQRGPASDNTSKGSKTMRGSDPNQQQGFKASSGIPPKLDINVAANEVYMRLLLNLTENDKAAKLEDGYDVRRLSTMVNEDYAFWLDENKWKEHKKKRKKVQFLLHPDKRNQSQGTGTTYDYSILSGCNHIFSLLDELYDRHVKCRIDYNNVRDADCPLAKVEFRNLPTRKAKIQSPGDSLKQEKGQSNPVSSKLGHGRRIPKRKRYHTSHRRYGSSEESEEEESIFYMPKKTKFG